MHDQRFISFIRYAYDIVYTTCLYGICPGYVSCLLQCHPLYPPQLVKVTGCNMWVMEETDGPSSDPPQTSHLQQKVQAQQYPTCSSKDTAMERDAMSLRIAGKHAL